MATVKFSLAAKATTAIESFHGSSARLVSVPRYVINGSLEPDCATGAVASITVKPEDNETPFEGINDDTYRMLNRDIEVAPQKGNTRIGAARITIKNIIVEAQVAVQRNLNTILTMGAKGENGRPLAIPQYRVRARSVITYDWTSIAEIQTYQSGGHWNWTSETEGGSGTARSEGLWGDILFLHEAKCPEPLEPPAGVQYNQFATIEVGKFIRKVTAA